MHLTLAFPSNKGRGKAEAETRIFLRKIAKTYKLKLAGVLILHRGMYNYHIHLLLISDLRYPNNLLKYLPDAFILYWEHQAKATTSEQWTTEQIAGYVSNKFNIDLLRPDDWDILYFRPRLLEKMKGISQ